MSTPEATVVPAPPPTIDGPEFKRHLYDWLGAEPGAPTVAAYGLLVEFINAYLGQHPAAVKLVHSLTLNTRQLRAALELANPHGESDVDQQETVVTITQREPFRADTDGGETVDCEAGLYLYCDDNPEDGLSHLPKNKEDAVKALVSPDA